MLSITKADGKLLLTDSFLIGFLAISLWLPSLASLSSQTKPMTLEAFALPFWVCVTPGMNWRCLSATPGSVAKGRPQMPSQRAAAPSVSSPQEKGLCHPHFSFSPHNRAKANNNLSASLYNQKNLWLSTQPERKPFVAAWKEVSACTWHCFSTGGDGCAPSHLHFSISSHDQG